MSRIPRRSGSRIGTTGQSAGDGGRHESAPLKGRKRRPLAIADKPRTPGSRARGKSRKREQRGRSAQAATRPPSKVGTVRGSGRTSGRAGEALSDQEDDQQQRPPPTEQTITVPSPSRRVAADRPNTKAARPPLKRDEADPVDAPRTRFTRLRRSAVKVISRATIPIGTLTKKIQRQDSQLVMAAPEQRPDGDRHAADRAEDAEGDAALAARETPAAISASEVANMIAPPTP